MLLTRRTALIASAGVLAATNRGFRAVVRPALAQASLAGQSTNQSLYDVAFDAYVFGYPAVYMEMTRRVRTAVPAYDPVSGRAPMNQMGHVTKLLDASFTDVVRANVDTLYDSAFLDLTAEPMVLSHPDFGDRYFLFPMLDQWTDVITAPGTRTTGQKAAAFALAGPDWRGTVPDGVQLIRATTSGVWIAGRINVRSAADVPAADALQQQVRITPLSAWGGSYTPPASVSVQSNVDLKTPPVDQVSQLGAIAFFQLLAELIKANPPHANDYPMVHRMAAIGLVPGQAFDVSSLTDQDRTTLRQAAADALAYIQKAYEGS